LKLGRLIIGKFD